MADMLRLPLCNYDHSRTATIPTFQLLHRHIKDLFILIAIASSVNNSELPFSKNFIAEYLKSFQVNFPAFFNLIEKVLGSITIFSWIKQSILIHTLCHPLNLQYIVFRAYCVNGITCHGLYRTSLSPCRIVSVIDKKRILPLRNDFF